VRHLVQFALDHNRFVRFNLGDSGRWLGSTGLHTQIGYMIYSKKVNNRLPLADKEFRFSQAAAQVNLVDRTDRLGRLRSSWK